ncbi:rubrerythrin [Paenibacillus anaericanus]|uniref:hypothetical protein n=1 Tax=Paenibacillus anaericanus TaxID=170367 RepID=UPI00277E146D|nr:hypothetical protein [Paenibacillus anaericanus]MDQ0091635.1 rubrerythrin [Paenibacillus anaericanus]
MNNKIKGMALYLCSTCEYHIAVEHGHFPDETTAETCPICGTHNPEFLRDFDLKGVEGFE